MRALVFFILLFSLAGLAVGQILPTGPGYLGVVPSGNIPGAYARYITIETAISKSIDESYYKLITY